MKLQSIIFFLITIIYTPAISQFTNVAATTGTDHGNDKDGGVAWADINNDGCLDIILNTNSNSSNNRSRILLSDCNLPNPSFTDITTTHANGLRLNKCERSISAGDYNNDGYIDFCRNTSRRIEVYLNKGPLATPAYSFGDGSQNPNFVLANNIPGGMNSEGFGWMDYNNDGWLDLLVENHNFGIDIYENPADGSSNFSHVTPNSNTKGLPTGGTSGDYMTLCDYDDDGDVDILARKEDEFDLWTNSGIGTFTSNTTFNEDALNGNKGGVLFCDFDNDGDFDFYWSDFGTNEIFLQTGINSGIFVASGEPTNSSGVTPSGNIDGCSCGDVDNDGDLDLFTGSNSGTSFLYLNDGGMNFTQNNLGINANADTEGNSFADYDNDGDLDLYINIDGGDNQLWRNSLNNTNYIKIHVKRDLGGGVFRDDLGATVVLKDCSGNIMSGIRQVSSVEGHGSNNPAIVHFGLPLGNTVPYLVEVRFTTVSGTRLIIDTAIVPSLVPNQTMTIISPDPANSGFDGCANILPIELLNFEANLNNDEVQLKWATASEINNDFFVIERSENSKIWESILTIDGINNNEKMNYSTTDFEPLNSISYYRLKQVDFNGDHSYSDIRMIVNKTNNSYIYPNPAHNFITLTGDSYEIVEFKIFNVLGQDVTESIKIISNNNTKSVVDLTNLSSGIYTIKTESTVNKLYKK